MTRVYTYIIHRRVLLLLSLNYIFRSNQSKGTSEIGMQSIAVASKSSLSNINTTHEDLDRQVLLVLNLFTLSMEK